MNNGEEILIRSKLDIDKIKIIKKKKEKKVNRKKGSNPFFVLA